MCVHTEKYLLIPCLWNSDMLLTDREFYFWISYVFHFCYSGKLLFIHLLNIFLLSAVEIEIVSVDLQLGYHLYKVFQKNNKWVLAANDNQKYPHHGFCVTALGLF